MPFWKGRRKRPATSEQAVIVHLAGPYETEVVFEDRLIAAIEEAEAGEFDGNEIALDGSEVVLYAYGSDADALFDAMEPALAELPPLPGSYALKRSGPADDPQARTDRGEL